jgi:hypothetical protein
MVVKESNSAEIAVWEAASRIGLTDTERVNRICDNLQEEYLVHAWQFLALDSSQWKALGAPIGLAAAIRKIHEDEEPDFGEPFSRKSGLGSRRSSMLTSKSKIVTKVDDQFRPQADEESSPEENEEGKEVEDENMKSRPPSSLREVFTAYRTWRPNKTFPLTIRFRRAILHSKSGYELKAHTVFMMELCVVVFALLTGAAVEMWGAFPQDYVSPVNRESPGEELSSVPRWLAFLFHTLSCITLLFQIVMTLAWVISLLVASSVSPVHFHKYFQQIQFVLSWFYNLSYIGIHVFIFNVGVLFSAQIFSMTTYDQQGIRLLGFWVPAVIDVASMIFIHQVTSYMGRVAYHGMLMSDKVVDQTEDVDSVESSGLARKAEELLCKSFYQTSETKDDDKVLDLYVTANTSRVRKRTPVLPPSGGNHLFREKDGMPKFQATKK